MAAIDKTYVSNWSDYKEIRDWAKVTDMIYPDGTNGGKMIDWFYYPNLTEQDFSDENTEYVLWNTAMSVDMFLYKNCPFKLVQDRLKEQYDISELSEKKSINKHEVGNHFKFPKRFIGGIYTFCVDRQTDKKIENWWYSDYHNKWTEYEEFGPWNTNSCIKNVQSRKAAIRLIRKWNLPKGSVVTVTDYFNRYNIIRYNIKIK